MAGLKGMTAKYACTRIRMAKILRGIRCPNPRYTVKEHVPIAICKPRAHFWKIFKPFLVRNILHMVPIIYISEL